MQIDRIIEEEKTYRTFVPSLSQVNLGHPKGVDWVPLVWVDDNHKET